MDVHSLVRSKFGNTCHEEERTAKQIASAYGEKSLACWPTRTSAATHERDDKSNEVGLHCVSNNAVDETVGLCELVVLFRVEEEEAEGGRDADVGDDGGQEPRQD